MSEQYDLWDSCPLYLTWSNGNKNLSLKNLREQRSKFAALYLQWWHLHMSEKFWSGIKKSLLIICHLSLFSSLLMDFHKTLWNHRPGKCHIVEGIGIIFLKIITFDLKYWKFCMHVLRKWVHKIGLVNRNRRLEAFHVDISSWLCIKR